MADKQSNKTGKRPSKIAFDYADKALVKQGLVGKEFLKGMTWYVETKVGPISFSRLAEMRDEMAASFQEKIDTGGIIFYNVDTESEETAKGVTIKTEPLDAENLFSGGEARSDEVKWVQSADGTNDTVAQGLVAVATIKYDGAFAASLNGTIRHINVWEVVDIEFLNQFMSELGDGHLVGVRVGTER